MTVQKRSFIIDTDPGIDDARCILFLLNKPDIEVKAITTVAGNTFNVLTSFNAGILTEMAGKKEVPIYQGSRHNLNAEIVTGEGFHGNNGLGDIRFPIEGGEVKKDMKSWEALLYYSKKYPSTITLLAIGPLTNLAMGFMYDPLFSQRFKNIFVMGSDRAEKTFSNQSTYAEFNTFSDPIAANIVYKTFRASERSPIFLLDWTFCCNHQLPSDYYDNLAKALIDKKRDSEAKIFFSKGDVTASVNHAVKMEVTGMIVADEFATLSAYDESLIESSELINVSTCLEGNKFGHTSFEPATGGNVRLITEMNMKRFLQTFYDAFGVEYN